MKFNFTQHRTVAFRLSSFRPACCCPWKLLACRLLRWGRHTEASRRLTQIMLLPSFPFLKLPVWAVKWRRQKQVLLSLPWLETGPTRSWTCSRGCFIDCLSYLKLWERERKEPFIFKIKELLLQRVTKALHDHHASFQFYLLLQNTALSVLHPIAEIQSTFL